MGVNCHESPTTYDEYIAEIMRRIDEAEQRYLQEQERERQKGESE